MLSVTAAFDYLMYVRHVSFRKSLLPHPRTWQVQVSTKLSRRLLLVPFLLVLRSQRGPASTHQLRCTEFEAHSATSIYPEMVKVIARSLLSAELNLSVSSSPRLRLSRVFYQVSEADLFIIIPPRVRKYRIRRNVMSQI